MALDDKDEKLLRALERNARASVVDLARRIGLSRSATQERLGRLERRGIIAGYTIVRATAPASAVEALLLAQHEPGVSCARITPELRKIGEVKSIHALAGDPDLAIWVRAGDTVALDQVAARIRSLPGIASVSTHVALADPLRR
jgi:DNA-binding Lrp family transcriptional regulator